MERVNAEIQSLYRLMRKELRMPPYTYQPIRKLSLRDLDLTRPEINWFLNQVEWQYGLEVEEDEISLDTSLEEFFLKIADRASFRSDSYLATSYQTAI